MGSKILIVEDQFIEANDLRLTLENGGHMISGIAKSFDQACHMLEDEKPDIVLLDIFLKGKLNGVDFGRQLARYNVPFIYLSANSNPSILELARQTRPSGFLVKPFRAQDVLAALDIANDRHRHYTDLILAKEKLVSGILAGMLSHECTTEVKFTRIAEAFNPYIPFDFLHIDADLKDPNLNNVFSLKRISFNLFEATTGSDLSNEFALNRSQYNEWRKKNGMLQHLLLENEEQLQSACKKDKFLNHLVRMSGMKSRICVPLISPSGRKMSVRFYSRKSQIYTGEHLEVLGFLRSMMSTVIESISWPIAANPGDELILPKRIALPAKPLIDGIVGNSPKLLRALDLASQVASSEMTVLVLGETGVGKEGLVKYIHRMSGRYKRPLIKINCAAIPLMLMESELFGHEKGAFTGAHERRIGKFEQADGGTIFLDEIGEIPLEVQTKLLRVLQEKELERVGGRTTIKIDVRVIAATNRNLHQEVINGNFRMDLYYRLNVFPIVLAPLRERREDIPLLITHFLEAHAALSGTEVKILTNGVMEKLTKYYWPGNIRELQHIIERNIILSPSKMLHQIELPQIMEPAVDTLKPKSENFPTIEEVDRAHIINALKKCNGKVAGKGGAAEILDMPATTLNSKMKRLGISWKFIY